MYQTQILSMFGLHEISTPGEFGVGNAFMVSFIGISVVLMELALLALCIVIIGKVIKSVSGKKPVEKTVDENTDDSSLQIPTIGERKVKLSGVDEKTAAMIMALVSHQSDIPLERLDFKSIKKVD